MHHFCTQSDCTCMEVLDTHWVGMFFLVAGLLLIVSANPKRRTHLWLVVYKFLNNHQISLNLKCLFLLFDRIVFSSFLVFAAHAMSTVYLTILSYFETDKRKCGKLTLIKNCYIVVYLWLFIKCNFYKFHDYLDILLGALLCIALGSFAVVCCTILVALAFIYLAQGAYGRSVYDDDDTCQ